VAWLWQFTETKAPALVNLQLVFFFFCETDENIQCMLLESNQISRISFRNGFEFSHFSLRNNKNIEVA